MKKWLQLGGVLAAMLGVGTGCTATGGKPGRSVQVPSKDHSFANGGDEQEPFTRTGRQGTDEGGSRSTGNN